MGGFLTGLFQTVGTGLREKNAQHQKQQAEEKQRQVDTQWTAMQTAVTTLDRLKRKQDSGEELTPEETQQAQQAAGVWQASQQEYGKLTKSNKPVNEAFQKFGGFVSKILTSKKNQLNGPQGQPQPQTMDKSPVAQGNGGLLGTGQVPKADAQPQASPNPLTGPPAAQAQPQEQPASQPLTGPPKSQQAQIAQLDPKQRALLYGSPQYSAEMDEKRKQQQKLGFEQAEYDAWLKRGKELGLKDRDLAEYAGSKGTKLPPQGHRTVDKGIVRPGDDPSTGKPYEGAWDHIVEPDGSESWQRQAVKQTASGVPRVMGHISATDAKGQASKGKKFLDEAGNEIDVTELPEQMALTAVAKGDKSFYVPITQAQTHFSVGGRMYAVPTLEQINLGKGSGVELGVSRTPTQSSHEQIAIDAQGNVTKNTLRSTSTPQTPGAAGRPASAQPPASGAPPPAQAQPRTPAPASSTAPKQSGDIKGIPTGMYNQSLQRVTPVREAATQIFGDPSQPELKPLISFSKLADNKESRERLGKALRLTFSQLNEATGGSHIAAGAGPISVSTGGVGTWLENYFNVPQKVAQEQVRNMQEAISGLTPEEKEAYDATMSAFGTVVGLRSLTRASAAQASVQTIEREMPVIGVNTTNSEQFLDQAQRLAEIVYNGTKGIPEGMWDPAMIQRLKGLPSEIQKMKKSKASPNGTLSAPSNGTSKRPRAVNDKGKAVEWDGKSWIPVP
jgi:hypothetical protein